MGGISFHLEGHQEVHMLRLIKDLLFSLPLDDSHLMTIQKSVQLAIGVCSVEMLEFYKAGYPIMVPASKPEHFYMMVLFQKYLVLCNRGFGLEGNRTIQAYLIPQSSVSELFLDSVMSSPDTELEIPDKLVRKDDICHALEASSPKKQKVRNCTWANSKAALKAVFLLICLLSLPKPCDYESKCKTDFVPAWKRWSYET